MTQKYINGFLTLTSRRYGTPKYVKAEHISMMEPLHKDGEESGTRIVLISGDRVAVKESSSEVYDAIQGLERDWEAREYRPTAGGVSGQTN